MVNAAGFQQGTLPDDRCRDLGVLQLAGGQVARARIDGKLLVKEGKRGIGLFGEGQVGFIERTDRTDILPVIVEQIGLKFVSALARDVGMISLPKSVAFGLLFSRSKRVSLLKT